MSLMDWFLNFMVFMLWAIAVLLAYYCLFLVGAWVYEFCCGRGIKKNETDN